MENISTNNQRYESIEITLCDNTISWKMNKDKTQQKVIKNIFNITLPTLPKYTVKNPKNPLIKGNIKINIYIFYLMGFKESSPGRKNGLKNNC